MLSLEGKQLGNYDVIRRIRVGGMGAVYEGRQRTAFDRRVAIKVILGDYATDRDMRRRFAREARTVARLHHPHILPLIEFGDEHGILYLVMPFIDGGTLTSYLRRSLPDLGEVAAIYQQLLDAVEYAHEEGLIHRDIKSSNVLLELRRSGPPYVYLADFGLVRTSSRRAGLDTTGEHSAVGKQIPLDQVPGTPHYMAPEQTRGIVTPQTDIYALGVLLFQMLTGDLPYNDEDDVRVIQMHLHAPIPAPSDRDASIPRELDEVVRRAMAKRPEERYASVAELRRAFRAAIKGPIATVPDPEPPIAFNNPSSSTRNRPRTGEAAHRRPTELILPEPRERSEIITERARRTEDIAPIQPVVRHDTRDTDEPQERPRIVPAPRPAARDLGRTAEHDRRAGAVGAIGQAGRRAGVRKRVASKKGKRRFGLTIALAMLIPIVFIVLLLMPRLLGISIFPSGFPLFGTAPVATITITVKSQLVQDSYVLTASAQVSTPDITARVIPARTLRASASGSRDVKTTGTQTTPGVQASGLIEFTNSSAADYTVVTGTLLSSASGVQIETTAEGVVQHHQKGKDGIIDIAAIAVKAGAAGNIAANAISGPCCNTTGISASNLQAFSGGVDAHTTSVVNQLDIDGATSSLTPELQRQVDQQLQKQLGPGDIAASQTTYTASTTSSQPPGAQASHISVTVTVQGTETVFNRDDATHMADQLLLQKASSLDSHYRQQGELSTGAPGITGTDSKGNISLTLSVQGNWLYSPGAQQTALWRQALKGATVAAARAYLADQPGIASADIHLPFGADHLPNDITIILKNS